MTVFLTDRAFVRPIPGISPGWTTLELASAGALEAASDLLDLDLRGWIPSIASKMSRAFSVVGPEIPGGVVFRVDLRGGHWVLGEMYGPSHSIVPVEARQKLAAIVTSIPGPTSAFPPKNRFFGAPSSTPIDAWVQTPYGPTFRRNRQVEALPSSVDHYGLAGGTEALLLSSLLGAAEEVAVVTGTAAAGTTAAVTVPAWAPVVAMGLVVGGVVLLASSMPSAVVDGFDPWSVDGPAWRDEIASIREQLSRLGIDNINPECAWVLSPLTLSLKLPQVAQSALERIRPTGMTTADIRRSIRWAYDKAREALASASSPEMPRSDLEGFLRSIPRPSWGGAITSMVSTQIALFFSLFLRFLMESIGSVSEGGGLAPHVGPILDAFMTEFTRCAASIKQALEPRFLDRFFQSRGGLIKNVLSAAYFALKIALRLSKAIVGSPIGATGRVMRWSLLVLAGKLLGDAFDTVSPLPVGAASGWDRWASVMAHLDAALSHYEGQGCLVTNDADPSVVLEDLRAPGIAVPLGWVAMGRYRVRTSAGEAYLVQLEVPAVDGVLELNAARSDYSPRFTPSGGSSVALVQSGYFGGEQVYSVPVQAQPVKALPALPVKPSSPAPSVSTVTPPRTSRAVGLEASWSDGGEGIVLVDASGTEWPPGPVPPGRYRARKGRSFALDASGSTASIEIRAGERYRFPCPTGQALGCAV